jgi:excisionase family DNA binding protein
MPDTDDLRHLAEAITVYRKWLELDGRAWPGDLDVLRTIRRAATTGQLADSSGQPAESGPPRQRTPTPARHPDGGSEAPLASLLATPEAARYLSISERSLRRLRDRGDLPAIRVGARGVRYRIADLDAYIDLSYR